MMELAMRLSPLMEAATQRLSALAPLDAADRDALAAAGRTPRTLSPRADLIVEGTPIREASLILDGWACRVRIIADGRRQILGFLLPGELVGVCRHSRPLALTTIVALTRVTLCSAPVISDGRKGRGLDEAYAVSAALEESYLLRHITRLGRFNAYERVADWLLELFERFEIGEATRRQMIPLPMTQEVIADTLGLTSVHVNRTIQAMRRDGLIDLKSGLVTLLDRDRCAALIDWRRAGQTNGGVGQVRAS